MASLPAQLLSKLSQGFCSRWLTGRSIDMRQALKTTVTKISNRLIIRPSNRRLTYGDIVPIFRWAGSKRKSLACLTAFWSDRFERYVEPFVGSACLFLKLKPKKAILGDLNSSLIQAYCTIRSHPRAVTELLYSIPRNAATYYHVRQRIRSVRNAVELRRVVGLS